MNSIETTVSCIFNDHFHGTSQGNIVFNFGNTVSIFSKEIITENIFCIKTFIAPQSYNYILRWCVWHQSLTSAWMLFVMPWKMMMDLDSYLLIIWQHGLIQVNCQPYKANKTVHNTIVNIYWLESNPQIWSIAAWHSVWQERDEV